MAVLIYDPDFGIINGGLKLIGLKNWTRPWLGTMEWALPSIALPAIWAGIGLFMLLLMGGIMSVSKSYYEAAEIDGANEWQQFWKITVPLIWPQIKTSILYIVITSLNGSFVLVQVMTKGGPGNATEVMGSYLYEKAFENFKFGYGAAIGILILVVSLATVLLLTAFIKKGKSSTLRGDHFGLCKNYYKDACSYSINYLGDNCYISNYLDVHWCI